MLPCCIYIFGCFNSCRSWVLSSCAKQLHGRRGLMWQANTDTESPLQTVASSISEVPKSPDGLGLWTSNSCLVLWWLEEQQQMLRCDGPAGELGSYANTLWAAVQMEQKWQCWFGQRLSKGRNGKMWCLGRNTLQQQNQRRMSYLDSHAVQMPPLRQGSSQQKL